MKPSGISLAILAAGLYALNSPFSKLLLQFMPSTLMAGFLYIGAGLGMVMIFLFRRIAGHPGNESLLNNFEIVATAVIALVIFKEAISPRLWLGILFVTASCALLSFEDISSLHFSSGSLFVILACICWGIENNCTRKLSSKDPLQIVMIKGLFSGTGSVVIGLMCQERLHHPWAVPVVLLLGFVAYGLSIYFYVYAQRILGAARTSVYYAVAPFIGVFLSLLIFREIPGILFAAALVLMIIGAWLSSQDKPLTESSRIIMSISSVFASSRSKGSPMP